MTEQDVNQTPTPKDHLERCLSMIMHYDDVQVMAKVIEKILADQDQDANETEEA